MVHVTAMATLQEKVPGALPVYLLKFNLENFLKFNKKMI